MKLYFACCPCNRNHMTRRHMRTVPFTCVHIDWVLCMVLSTEDTSNFHPCFNYGFKIPFFKKYPVQIHNSAQKEKEIFRGGSSYVGMLFNVIFLGVCRAQPAWPLSPQLRQMCSNHCQHFRRGIYFLISHLYNAEISSHFRDLSIEM